MRPVDDVLLAHRAGKAVLQRHHRLHRLAAARIVRGHHAHFTDRRMPVHQGLDLGRPDLVAGSVDHALQAVDHEEVAVLVDPPQVAGAEKNLAVDLDEGIRARSRIVPVAPHHLGPVHDDLADLAHAQFPHRLRVDHARIDVADRDAQALLLRAVVRVDVGRRDGLGHAIALDVADTHQLLHALGDRVRHGRPAATQAPDARQIVFHHARAGQQVHHHGRDQLGRVHAVAADAFGRGVAVPARQHHHGAATEDRAVHPALHAGHVEERQHAQCHRILLGAEPLHAGHRVVHHAAVGVHAALRVAGGARGIRHAGQVVRASGDRAGNAAARQHVAPQGYPRPGDVAARRGHEVRHLEVGLVVDVVRIGGHQHVLQAGLAGCGHQRLDLGIQVLRREDGGGAGVAHVMAQFFGQVHRIDRHHHRVGAQDGVIGQHELRTVLHVEQHAVALAHAAFLLQVAGNLLDLELEIAVAERRVVEDREGLVRVAGGRHFQVVEQIRLRHGQVPRQARGPEFEMALRHRQPPVWMNRRDER